WPGTSIQPFHITFISPSNASPPIQVWMPNHPQATMALAIAATFAPRVPKLARQRTGNDTPYLVPACAFKIIGIKTIVLPSRIVSMACHQFIPCSMNPPARVYVVITTDIPIQRAAMLYVDHVRWPMLVGARSGFHSGLVDTSSRSSTNSELESR